jgi:hypothetical protein
VSTGGGEGSGPDGGGLCGGGYAGGGAGLGVVTRTVTPGRGTDFGADGGSGNAKERGGLLGPCKSEEETRDTF